MTPPHSVLKASVATKNNAKRCFSISITKGTFHFFRKSQNQNIRQHCERAHNKKTLQPVDRGPNSWSVATPTPTWRWMTAAGTLLAASPLNSRTPELLRRVQVNKQQQVVLFEVEKEPKPPGKRMEVLSGFFRVRCGFHSYFFLPDRRKYQRWTKRRVCFQLAKSVLLEGLLEVFVWRLLELLVVGNSVALPRLWSEYSVHFYYVRA